MITKTMPFSLGQKLQRKHVSKKILAANEVMQHARHVCFPFVGMVVMFNFYCSQFVLTVFPSSSQWVPQHVPNSSSLYLTSFALKFSLVVYISSPQAEIPTYLFWDCSKALINLFFVMGQSKMPITKDNKVHKCCPRTLSVNSTYL
jgi:hypothetical protein